MKSVSSTFYCQKCRTEAPPEGVSCGVCGTPFSQGSVAVGEVVSKPSPAAKWIIGLGVWSLLASLALFVTGLLVTLIVPGCSCDEGAGCRGCGVNDLVAFCLFGGFIGAVISALFVLPVAAILGLLVGMLSDKKPSDN